MLNLKPLIYALDMIAEKLDKRLEAILEEQKKTNELLDRILNAKS